MTTRGVFMVGVAAAALLAPVARAADVPAKRCELGTRYHVSSIAPYQKRDNTGFSPTAALRGATLRIEAVPGLIREWLQTRLEAQVADGSCNFGVRKVNVEVLGEGDHFLVQLSGPDRKSGDAILRSARALLK